MQERSYEIAAAVDEWKQPNPMDIQILDPSELTLDRKNPRFGLQIAEDEPTALSILAEKANLKELWDSIAERGYEPFEPLVAAWEDGSLVVLEGNRRLAAVKALLARDEGAYESLRKRIPQISPEKLETCRKIPVTVVANRAEAAGYIGFKHVNGPTRWSSLAKAKFGVDFYESIGGGMTPQQKMQSLTKQLGDSRGLILRLLVAYKIVRQAITTGIFEQLGVDSETIEFSHLYTMMNNPDSRAFIGLSRAPLSESLIADNPVPETHLDQLSELLGFLYGKNAVIKAQGTDRPRLQRVLASADGLRELRITGDLSMAETVAGIVTEDWLKDLAKIVALMAKSATEVVQVVDELGEEDIAQANSFLRRLERHVKQTSSALAE